MSQTRVETSSPPFDGAAEAAVRRWQFRPAQRKGIPVAAIVRLTLTFVGGEHEIEPDTEPEWFTDAVRLPAAGVQPPKVIKEVRPGTSNWCETHIARPTGDVWLDVRVETNGRVSRTRIVPLLSIPGRAAAAHEAARQWEFVPAFIDGRPIPAIVRVKLSFADQECSIEF